MNSILTSIRLSVVVAAAVSIVFVSCQKPDEEAPSITQFLLNGIEMGDTVSISAGSLLEYKVVVADNAELGQSRTNVLPTANIEEGEWSYLVVNQLGGTNEEVNLTLVVPDTVRGYWLIKQDIIDAEGNEGEQRSAVLNVNNSIIPLIKVDAINYAVVPALLQVAEGDSIIFDGNVNDPGGLESVVVKVTDTSGSVEYEQNNNVSGSNWNLTLANFNMPSLPSGSGMISIRAEDDNNHIVIWSLAINIED